MIVGRAILKTPWLITFFIIEITAFAIPDFQREIRPILAGHCFKCHGPDKKTREADLRLDIPTEEASFIKLVERINHKNPNDIMPPPSAKKPLSEAQKQLLNEWVQAGAKYTDHWAFITPKAVSLPKINQPEWARNEIDYFTLVHLEANGQAPTPKANRFKLIRRLSLDIIGLPPTPEEIGLFVEDTKPNAYERLVDRLLDRPEFGEHWALPWLDLARYADTNGYEKDRPRSIWPWRNWVINAINNDLPFDQFTVEQIAGDMLPKATQSQRIATGFHRNTMVNEEGGIDPLEFRFYAMVDRVNTTATTWLGLTLGCAQCHTHKFDPVPHRSYYEMMAFLNNSSEPELSLITPEQKAQQQSNESRIVTQLLKLPIDKAKYDTWIKTQKTNAVSWINIIPSKMKTSIGWLELLEDGSIFARGDTSKHDVYKFEFTNLPKNITSIRLEALPDERLPKGGPGRAYYEGPKGDFFLSEISLTSDGKPIEITSGSENYAKQWIGSSKPSAMAAADGDLQTGWSTSGREGKHSQAVWQLSEPLKTKTIKIKLDFSRHYSASLGRFRLSVTSQKIKPKAKELPGDIEKLLVQKEEDLDQKARNKLRLYYINTSKNTEVALAKIAKLQKKTPPSPTTLVMQERPEAHLRLTHRHHRGEFLSPREVVKPKVLPFLPPLEKDMPRNRLGFAYWLINPNNPLTSRVVVNRFWSALFGEGIVRTTDDFGYTGASPTHPELLDWLAIEFIRQGWSRKKILRLIVSSSTYRQNSQSSFRLSAEQIRDSVLKVSNLLNQKVGGQSVFPPQNKSIGEGIYGGGSWQTSSVADQYRRSLYTYRKRSMPFAMHNTFDAPSHETCIARREISNTPLQALTLLNDSFFLDASRTLGRWAAQQNNENTFIIDTLFQRCLTRRPSPMEQKAMLSFYKKTYGRFSNNKSEASKFAGASKGDVIKQASWTALARVILNTHEFITRN